MIRRRCGSLSALTVLGTEFWIRVSSRAAPGGFDRRELHFPSHVSTTAM